MTQEEMAKILGVDPSTLARWEKNKRHPCKKYFALLQRLFSPSANFVNESFKPADNHFSQMFRRNGSPPLQS
jgi:transcriptional regulator with XRE-family HTH domain